MVSGHNCLLLLTGYNNIHEKKNVLSQCEIFSDEISARPGNTGLLFLRDKTQPSLLYNGQSTAVSLTPLLCPQNILTGSLVHSYWSSNVEA